MNQTKTVIIARPNGKPITYRNIGEINISTNGNVTVTFNEDNDMVVRHDNIKPYSYKRTRGQEARDFRESDIHASVWISRKE